ncbi:MAG: (2Fe-2S)-binding protein [Deltaproteobacteria bacterium]|nr:MAG: (2Fe-2S)-binding protein [Deltaproteobacteria bacterium]
MKKVSLLPLGRQPEIKTNARVLDALLAEEVGVMMACGGRGLCATCHVFVEEGSESLSPRNAREDRTLGRLSGTRPNSRLACQARVCGEGVRVSLPDGLYALDRKDIESLIGKRARTAILHPIDGRVLVEPGKIITRSFIMQLNDVDFQVNDDLADDA